MQPQNERQNLSIFLGTRSVLLRFKEIATSARVYALPGTVPLCVVPLDDVLQDAMHKVFGTGDWLKNGMNLSTGDMAVAARISNDGPVAYIEISSDEGANEDQLAMVWVNGTVIIKPMKLRASEVLRRPRSLWPVNIALKQLGVVAAPQLDESQTVGLFEFMSADDIAKRAIEII